MSMTVHMVRVRMTMVMPVVMITTMSMLMVVWTHRAT